MTTARMTLAAALAGAVALAGPVAAQGAAVPAAAQGSAASAAAPAAWTSLPAATPARSAATIIRVRRAKLNAHFVLTTHLTSFICAQCGAGGTPAEIHGCDYEIFLEFPAVPGASSYRAVVQDTNPRVNTTYDLKGPPFSDLKDGYRAPAGTHRFGPFTGGSGPAPCYTLADFKGRFILKKATVAINEYCYARASAAASGGLPLSCPTLKYTQQEKDDAKEWKQVQEDRYVFWGGVAATATAGAAGAAAVGAEPVALMAGILAAGNGVFAWWASREAILYGRIAEDPPDRNWRRIVGPVATHPERIALPAKLSRRNRTAVLALFGNQLRIAALARCVAQSIDRGTTARPKNPRIAARQYAAGGTCAREQARRTGAIPRLVAPIVKLMRPYDAQILAAAATAPRGPAFRRLVARNLAALAKAGGLTRADRKALATRTLAAPATPATLAPSAAVALVANQASQRAAALRKAARVLAAAAAGR